MAAAHRGALGSITAPMSYIDSDAIAKHTNEGKPPLAQIRHVKGKKVTKGGQV
jgi:hypothetical protein